MKGAPSDGMPGARSIWQGLEVLCSLPAYRKTCYNCGQVKSLLWGANYSSLYTIFSLTFKIIFQM